MLIFTTPPALVQQQEAQPKDKADLSYEASGADASKSIAFWTKQKFKPYKDLVLTAKDKENITELFKILATYSPLRLGKKKDYLDEELGPAVGRVHPLKMMEYFTNTPEVKEYVARVRTRSVFMHGKIWPNYIGPTGKDLDQYAARGELAFYAKDFAKAVNKDEKTLKTLFDKREWTALFDYLLDRNDDT